MFEFSGRKVRLVRKYEVKDYSEWWNDNKFIEKKEYKLTRDYKNYLEYKRKVEREEYILVLKSKLEWQLKEYGEVDEIDFNEYMAYIKGTL